MPPTWPGARRDFGVVLGGAVGVDMKRVKARQDALVRSQREAVEKWLTNLPNCTVYQRPRAVRGRRTRSGSATIC